MLVEMLISFCSTFLKGQPTQNKNTFVIDILQIKELFFKERKEEREISRKGGSDDDSAEGCKDYKNKYAEPLSVPLSSSL